MPVNLWAWRVVPSNSLDQDFQCGVEMTRYDAMQVAATALEAPDSNGFAVLVTRVGIVLGEGLEVSKPVFGLRSAAGNVCWLGTD